MCGIVGYIGKNNRCQDILINGLKELEYRGYDSSGIAYEKDNELIIIKEQGKICELEKKLHNDLSNIGIGHTRWATHGKPNQINSHPHKQGKITIVHNGIIENYLELKSMLIDCGYIFNSETDSEVAAALIDYLYNQTNDMNEAIISFEKKVKGAYAIGIIVDDDYNSLYAIKKASPLIIGIGKNENYIASDVPAILKYTKNYVTLNDGEFVKMSYNKIDYFDKNGSKITKQINVFDDKECSCNKNGYEHFMLKEIYEQPNTIKNTINSYIENNLSSLYKKMPDFSKYENIIIVACGSAMHAGLIGKNLIEEFANIPVTVEVASEFRYKNLFINEKTLVIAISQSGETADTLAAVEIAKTKNSFTLGIINRKNSSIARNVDYCLYTEAGIEIAVATTKAYTAQVAMLALIALNIGSKNKNFSDIELKQIFDTIKILPIEIEALLNDENILKIKEIANTLYNNNDVYFIGRNIDYAICMEGSLKLKEISYIHSDAYPAGELKHGTISLIEDGTPVISVVTEESIADKTISNIKEVRSRGATVILITTNDLNKNYDCVDYNIVVPKIHKLFQGILTIIPLQLLSYEVAKLKNCNIDQPKNLAKSVTVE